MHGTLLGLGRRVGVDELRGILREYWGYGEFRPQQAEAMRAVVEGRDSVVILPTGGGKSLCFQAPRSLCRAWPSLFRRSSR